ncbi:MAG: STAS domain-containing protein [Actinomycetota bacterium]|nr:STAS domain-containing protein [Actinomycetota bacterium]
MPDQTDQTDQLGLEVDDSRPDRTVVSITGEIDLSTAPLFRDRLVELANGGSRHVVVDLESVDFIDSTGLGVLVASLTRMRKNGGDMSLVCSQPRILRVFEITGLTKVFTIYRSLDEIGATST